MGGFGLLIRLPRCRRFSLETPPRTWSVMSDGLERLSSEALERMLLDASELPGRKAMARVTAIRTILARRPRRQADTEAEERHAQALALVNACRGPGEQLTEVHATWVDSILADESWAPLYASGDELRVVTASPANDLFDPAPGRKPTKGGADGR